MIGQTISHYTITGKLGEGGMGIVYKAHDTKLERDVALKFLPPHLKASEDDKARFVQEAKAASALNHPNVCTIHDIREHEGQMFLVMEYVDGKTLGEKKGTLSFKQSIEICIQVAEGLAAAHGKGIVHRDIKPENIMLRKDGIAQIMDFGLAKLRGVTRLTKEGSTVGTAGYMAPEQIQGEEVDHRADIFSLGVLIYELVTGQAPFKGVHETALLYEIVNVDAVPMTVTKSDIDPELDRIVLECLEKDPNERTQSAKQVAIDLKRFRRESGRSRVSRVRPVSRAEMPASVTTGSGESLPGPGSPDSSKLPWLVAGISAIVAVSALAYTLLVPVRVAPVVRSAIQPPPNVRFAQASGGIDGGHIALSPDGTRLAFVAADSGGSTSLWIRPLNSLKAIRLQNTQEAYYPFWSPDNEYIAFFSGGKLKKILAAGGPPLTICDAPSGRGGSWNQDGQIIFSPNFSAGIFRVAEDGGTPVEVTSLDSVANEGTHRWPWFLPDGEHFLFFSRITGGNEGDQIYIGSLDGSLKKSIMPASCNMAYADGFLFFVRENVLLAQKFDVNDFQLSGNALPLAERVYFNEGWSRGLFSVSQAGILVYQSGGQDQGTKLAWCSRTGELLSFIPGLEFTSTARLSGDEKKIALEVYDPQSRNEDVWIHDIARGTNTRLTFEEANDRWPHFSPDDSKIVWSSNVNGRYDLFQKNADGTGAAELLYASPLNKAATSWSSDGQFLSMTTFGVPETNVDLWTLPLADPREPFVVVRGKFTEGGGVISPDMRWIAYRSDETGRTEVYVRPFRKDERQTGGKWQVSTDGTTNRPIWSANGRLLHFQSVSGKYMVVDVSVRGDSFEPGLPRTLFEFQPNSISEVHAVTADNKRFLVEIQPVAEGEEDMNLVLNWKTEIRE